MARTIRYSCAILIGFAAFATSARAQSESKTVERDVVIVLPSNLELSPGSRYPAEIVVSGERVATEVRVPGIPPTSQRVDRPKGSPAGAEREVAPSPTPGPEISEDASAQSLLLSPAESDWLRIALAALIPIVLTALGGWVYWKVIWSRKQLRPYREALNHLRDENYEEALRLLTRVESKLSDQLRCDARFFIAFANMQLNNTQEAEYELNALHRENPNDSNAAYLLAYIRIEAGHYDEAEPVLERMEANGRLDLHQARKLLGIVKFQRALTAIQDGRVDAAGELFDKVQALGDFATQIPADLRNRHIVLGTKALFEKDLPEARKQFESLQKVVAKSPDEQRDRLLATAKIGLALAKWIEEAPDEYSNIEELLVEAARLLDPDGPTELTWPTDATEKSVVEKLEDLDAETDLSADQKEVNHLLRDLHFLRGMAVLHAWGRMDCEAAHQALSTQYESALARLACSRARDEEFNDVYLVVGLLMYYLHKPGPERSRGVDLLQEAQKRGMHDPDAMEIINNRERIERADADAVDKYLQVLDNYLNDDTVRKEVRLDLMERLSRYGKIQGWEKRPDLALRRSVEPTVAEMRNRSEILLSRVDQIISSRSESKGVARIRELSQAMKQDSQKLYEQAKAIENEESQLLAETGNQLFQDQ